DLSAEMPERAAELEGLLDGYLAAVDALLPKENPQHVPGTTYSKKGGGGGKGGGERRRPGGGQGGGGRGRAPAE
ncbi:MAG: hypothetical protein AAF591_17745, partial [Verrucomicrobiota bacterium]